MIYYINFDGVRINVFDSQIFTPIKLMKENDINIKLINFASDISSIYYQNKIRKIEEELNDKVLSIKRLKIGFIVLHEYVQSLCTYIRKTNAESIVIFHCRNAFAGYLALKAKKRLKGYRVKVITDFRGVIAEECRLVYSKRNFAFKLAMPLIVSWLSHIEKYAARNSDFRLFVSKQLEAYMHGKYELSLEKSKVIPTCIDSNKLKFNPISRKELRKKFNIDNRYVVIYSGSTREWQIPKRQVEVFAQIRKQLSAAYFLILTKDKVTFESYLKGNGISQSDYMITSCEHDDIDKYLSCADIALLLREDDIVNRVSSPTKFAEYLSCHLPVVVSKNIGDTDKIIAEYKVGIFDTEISKLNSQLAEEMKKIDSFDEIIDKYYSWHRKIENLAEIYRLLGVANEAHTTARMENSNQNGQNNGRVEDFTPVLCENNGAPASDRSL